MGLALSTSVASKYPVRAPDKVITVTLFNVSSAIGVVELLGVHVGDETHPMQYLILGEAMDQIAKEVMEGVVVVYAKQWVS